MSTGYYQKNKDRLVKCIKIFTDEEKDKRRHNERECYQNFPKAEKQRLIDNKKIII